MSWNSVRVLSSYVVREFIAGGGKLRYRPGRDELGRYWEVLGVDREGNELPVIIGRTGHPKLLRSADAVVGYQAKMFPGTREVLVPVHEDENGTDQDVDDN